MSRWGQEIAWRRLAGVPLSVAADESLADIDAAYRIQRDANTALAKSLGPVAGLKIGCTTPVMRKYLGIDEPASGEIFASTIIEGEARLSRSDYRKLGIECEIAVRIAENIGPGDGPRDPKDVVASLHAAAEIVDDRYLDYRSLGVGWLIADNFFNAGAVIGPPVEDWRALDRGKILGRTVINGEEAGRGLGESVMGDPMNALQWLIARRQASGLGIAKDTIVLLGSVVETKWLSQGDDVTIELEGLGRLRIGVT